MTDSEPLRQEIQETREEISEFKKTVSEHLENRPEKQRAARVERVQIVVALAIVTVFVSLYTSGSLELPARASTCVVGLSGYPCALGGQALLASLFLLIKTVTMTSRPILDYDFIDRIDDYWLPAFYIPLLLFSVIAGFGVIFLQNAAMPGFTVIYIIGEVLVLFTLGRRYARNYEEKMGRIYASSPNNEVSVTRGPRAESVEFYITNEEPQDLERGDIQFTVEAADGVSINFTSAYRIEEDKWEFAGGLKSGKKKRVVVELNVDSGVPLDKETVKITPIFDGTKEESVEFSISG